MESNTVIGPDPEALNEDQKKALERAIKNQAAQEERVTKMTPEERAKWGITTNTAAEQTKLDEEKNPSGVKTGQ